MAVEITCKVRGPTLAMPFGKIVRQILGENYSLSLVLAGDKLTRKINRTYRKKDYPANVLSFPLSKNDGEIFLNVRHAEREAKALGISARSRIAHLFTHGCLHLAGFSHGRKMDSEEDRVLARFGYKK